MSWAEAAAPTVPLVKPADPRDHWAMDLPGPSSEQLGRVFQALRESSGLTILELSERSGVPSKRIVMIESGLTDPVLEEMCDLAKGLGLALASVIRRWEERRS